MKRKLLTNAWLPLLLLLTGIAGCTSSTQIMGSWKSSDIEAQNYRRVVVAALTDNLLARQEVENDLQAQLQTRGIQATRSIDLFPPSATAKASPDVNLLIERIKADGHDAILTAALVDEQTETRYVPGNMGYRPVTRFMWYGSFRGYYTYWYPTLYDPGYYTEDKVYYLETNLYDINTDRLVWSAQSKSHSPRSLRKAASKFAELTIQKMIEDNVLPAVVSQ
ncbi:hypothetical protein K3G39_13085 [Pontibacter sp. HSC-14F20]|uniref:hypothetical protein n=1 Tax=Pontibacter sp. HSC-14F20 TaxID=2864136 RepID=UPI001C73750F|nr:hypothetical protein [Pontibacter sp. HSC-14F20]MBX0334171.1 hypothetical protein [Pontibacter sp. HSC-14F20]